MTQSIPLKRMGQPMNVAYESNFVTGIELVVDGGILAGSAATPEKNSG